ncbi:MAG: type IV pilus modification protein PilV [Gammaproteobacteria bacterium]|jgi:type IV pilus assembly protein PilV|nr:type IV pilus modification protein PilV [Gammaproteobacteria bacterium]MBT4494552.1 type IV pilus modification protein PilV [Gammaproteobacteria bacterium]
MLMRRQSGFSMIELLISVVIMSIGVLGMAGLQIISMQQNRSALLQGEATLRSNDILDRIRANPSSNYSIALNTTPSVTTDCVGNTCSESEMMDYDIAQWQCSINSNDASGDPYTVCANFGITGALPGGHCASATSACAGGSIALTSGVYDVTIQWVDQQTVDANATNATTRSITVSMRAP